MANHLRGATQKKPTSDVRKEGEYKVYRRPQPHGEEGVRFSLNKVAEKIAEGRLHPDVRAWTTKTLAAVGNPKGPRKRAAAILDAIRTVEGFPKASRWVPDPTASEFIAGAHLTLGDGTKPPLFALGDCDDLTVAFGSAVLAPIMYLAAAESVGANAAVVGHAYGKDKMIEHVLGAIYDEGRWWYADPSVKDLPFGECKPFTRERVYLVPSLELLCDATVCLTDKGPAAGPPPPPRRGDFVAVDGFPGQDFEDYEGPRTLLGFCDLSGCCGDDDIDTLARLAARAAVSRQVPEQIMASQRTQDAADAQAWADAAVMDAQQAQQQADALTGAIKAQQQAAADQAAQQADAEKQKQKKQIFQASQAACQECAQAHSLIPGSPFGGGGGPSGGGPSGPSGGGGGPPLTHPTMVEPMTNPTPEQVVAANASETRQAAVIKADRLANQAQFAIWADAPQSDNPLAWNIVNVPPQTDWAAQELYQPWHDGLEPESGASWEIKNSAFLQRKDR